MSKLFFLLLFLFEVIALQAQVFSESLLVEICTNKTVSLVFPSNIVSTDRGSDQVMVQKAADNILKVKSAKDSCRETNLTVVTADSRIYSFIIRFTEYPAHLTIYLGTDASVKTVNKLEPFCNKVIKMKPSMMGLQYSSGKVSLQMFGWYVHDQFMFCKLKIENRSQIGYDIEQLRFYLRDNNTIRRTASQEINQQPLLVSGDTLSIKGRSARVWVIALNKFTIPDDKHFEVEVLEKNGGRHLYLRVYNRQLMLAKEF